MLDMSLNTKFNSLLPRLISKASTSTINMQLCAAIIKGKMPVSNICVNTEKSMNCGQMCGSLHAEAHAIMDYYGKGLFWTEKQGWCFLPSKQKRKAKEKRSDRYPGKPRWGAF
jgi:hypothetical protein